MMSALRYKILAIDDTRQNQLILHSLLFDTLPIRAYSLSMVAYAEPSKGIAGDFYQYFAYNSRMFDIAIGDVMGKGIPAGVMIQVIRTQLKRHEGNDNLQDDHSCIALHYEGEAESLHTIRMFDLTWQLESLVEMRHQTLICAGIVGLSAEDSAALVLASIETLSNIIRHAQPPLPDASIHVQFNLAEYGIGLTHYLGETFQPEERIDIRSLITGDRKVNFALEEGDVIYVPKSRLAEAGYVLRQLLPGLSFLSLGISATFSNGNSNP